MNLRPDCFICDDEIKEGTSEAPKILHPVAHTAIEGGNWYAWAGENITEEQLICCPIPNKYFKLIQGKFKWQIHAIKFSDGRVWDCINGWRKKA